MTNDPAPSAAGIALVALRDLSTLKHFPRIIVTGAVMAAARGRNATPEMLAEAERLVLDGLLEIGFRAPLLGTTP